MAGLIGWLTSRMGRARSAPAFQRDPAFLKRWTPTLTRALRWFRPSIEGSEHVPSDGPFILVANHSGGMWTPEAYVLVDWWVREFGPSRPLYLLAHDFLFAIPLFTRALRRAGGIPASMDNAHRALDKGGAVLIFPGGDQEAFRPWWDRHRIDFGGRTGFVKLALASGAPVLPAVCHGSHDTTIVLTRGRRIARRLRLRRMRSEIMPFVLGPPWGIVPGFVPTLPLPARIQVRLLPTLRWSAEKTNDDRSLIRRCYDQTTAHMQTTLDAMAREQPWPLLARFRHKLGSAGPL